MLQLPPAGARFVDLSTNFYTRSAPNLQVDLFPGFLLSCPISAFPPSSLMISVWILCLWLNQPNRVYEDEEEWFWEIFLGSKKEDVIRNKYDAHP
jgi:hypothetical protein